MKAVAVIPARGGSRRVPGKNIRAFHGQPIIAYSIQVAQRSGIFDKICVSTDDPKIAKIAFENGAGVQLRPGHLAEDHIGTQEVMAYALERLLAQVYVDERMDYACCIYPCAPLLTTSHLDQGFMHCSSKNSYAFAVGADPLRDTGMFYWGPTAAFLERRPLVHPSSTMIPIEEERCIDINTEADFTRAELMHTTLLARAAAA